MKTRILKKINKFVRIIEDEKGNFIVQRRSYLGLFAGMSEWEDINVFSTYKKAVNIKNIHIVMVIMRELGYRNEFVKRRTERKKARGLI